MALILQHHFKETTQQEIVIYNQYFHVSPPLSGSGCGFASSSAKDVPKAGGEK